MTVTEDRTGLSPPADYEDYPRLTAPIDIMTVQQIRHEIGWIRLNHERVVGGRLTANSEYAGRYNELKMAIDGYSRSRAIAESKYPISKMLPNRD